MSIKVDSKSLSHYQSWYYIDHSSINMLKFATVLLRIFFVVFKFAMMLYFFSEVSNKKLHVIVNQTINVYSPPFLCPLSKLFSE